MGLLKIFFAVDIHGSTACFKKFMNALDVYGADIGILGGDLSGKMIVPIIIEDDGRYVYDYLGEHIETKSKDGLKDIEKKLAYMGNYYIYVTREEYEQLLKEGKTIEGRIDEKARKITLAKGKIEELFVDMVTSRLREWLEYATERLKKNKKKIYIIPGNDDLPEVDEVIKEYESDHIIFADLRKVGVDGHEMVGLSWANKTPWDTPREYHEEVLKKKIDKLASQINDMENAIFQLHVPPYGTPLDEAPKLDEQLHPSVSETIHAGSKAVYEAIKEYQPLLALHGHIHESRGIIKIGRTICINPGSEYTEGILRGVMVYLDSKKKKVKNFIFTSG
jgi:hypothetical protein